MFTLNNMTQKSFKRPDFYDISSSLVQDDMLEILKQEGFNHIEAGGIIEASILKTIHGLSSLVFMDEVILVVRYYSDGSDSNELTLTYWIGI